MPLSGCGVARFAGQLYFAAALIRACYRQIFASLVFRVAVWPLCSLVSYALYACFAISAVSPCRFIIRKFCFYQAAIILYHRENKNDNHTVIIMRLFLLRLCLFCFPEWQIRLPCRK